MTDTAAGGSLKQRQRAEREKLILQVAEEMLAEKGFHETSMEEIAQRVGVSKGTIYLHFASKEDLILTLIRRYGQDFLEGVGQIFTLALGPRAKLEAILRSFSGSSKRLQLLITLRQDGEIQKILKERQERQQQAGDKTQESLQRPDQQFIAEIRALFEAGKTTGEFDATLPTEVMLSTFFGALLSALIYQRLTTDTQVSPEAYVEYLAHTYFNGISAH
jgi:TetR/AcrR family transcriptional regulator, fatty acid metabolism regulator protein